MSGLGRTRNFGGMLETGGKRDIRPVIQSRVENARQYNIRDEDGHYLCPACGLPGFFQGDSYDESGGVIATGICPCCLWEPGYDDNALLSGAPASILESLRQYRRGWSSLGPAWSGRPEQIPPGWNGQAQLAHLFKVAPHVR